VSTRWWTFFKYFIGNGFHPSLTCDFSCGKVDFHRQVTTTQNYTGTRNNYCIKPARQYNIAEIIETTRRCDPITYFCEATPNLIYVVSTPRSLENSFEYPVASLANVQNRARMTFLPENKSWCNQFTNLLSILFF